MSATEKNPGSSDILEASSVEVLASEGRPYGPDDERKLVRRLDMRIMPVVCVLYLFACKCLSCATYLGRSWCTCVDLDRINLGNARLQGLPQDVLHGDPTGVLFDWVNSAFYFSYVCCSAQLVAHGLWLTLVMQILCPVPAIILSKLCQPRLWFGCAAICWGLCSVLMVRDS